MHACTVDSATTSTQHPSPTPSVPSRSLASIQIAVFAPEGGTLSAESGVRFLIFVCDWGNWPYPFAGQLGQLLPNVQPASPLLVHELLSGPHGSPLYPYTSSAVAGLVAFSHSSARSPHPCDHFCSTSRLFCFCMLYPVVCSRFLGQPRSFLHSLTSHRACSQPSCAFPTYTTSIPMLVVRKLSAIRAKRPLLVALLLHLSQSSSESTIQFWSAYN